MVLNVWEAVYFDHRLEPLLELAEAAAGLGVERFVLDDGWFRGRRDDHAGLGDWYVDEDLWPEGLTPLIDAVTGHGMEFGLWVRTRNGQPGLGPGPGPPGLDRRHRLRSPGGTGPPEATPAGGPAGRGCPSSGGTSRSLTSSIRRPGNTSSTGSMPC